MEVVEKADTDPSSEETFHTPPGSPITKENELQKSDTSLTIDNFFNKLSKERQQIQAESCHIDTSTARDKQPPSKKKCRFTSDETNGNLLQNIAQNIPENTRNQNIWCVNIWKAWASWRNGVTDASLEDSSYKTVPLDPRNATEKEFGFWLSRFVIEVRNSKGAPYPPNSILNLLYGIQRYCNNRTDGPNTKLKIFDLTNPNFNDFYQACEKVMKNLTLQGVGQDVKKADIITDSDEEKLWSTGTINLDTPQGLLYGVYFYNVRAFALQGGKIHRALEKDHFRIEFDLQLGVEKLIYSERLTTTKQAGLNRLKPPPVKPEILAQADNPRCIVNFFKTYLSRIPDVGPFYLQPSRVKEDNIFSLTPVGINALTGFLPKMYQLANIDLSGRCISGRSGRATISYKLLSEGFMKSTVKERSGLQQKYFQSYMPADETTRVGVSDVLQAKRPADEEDDDGDYDEMPPLRPIQLNNNIRPIQLNNIIRPIQISDNVRPIQINNSIRPIQINNSMRPMSDILNDMLRPVYILNAKRSKEINNSIAPFETIVIKEEKT